MKVKTITEETSNTENRIYAEVKLTGRSPTRRLSKTKNAGNKHKQNIHTISPINRFRRQGNNLSKKPSNTNIKNNYTQQQKINELPEEINKLKHQGITDEHPVKAETAHQTISLS